MNYFQKYYLFFACAISLLVIIACSTTKKVPDGQYLLTKNSYQFDKKTPFDDEVDDYVRQKPNKGTLFFLPFGLWMYNAADPKYDSVLNEYSTYPAEMRNQKLRDSLFIKNNKPQYVGKSLFFERFLHNLGEAPVILDEALTESSADAIRKFMVYRGYWDAEVAFSQKLDSAAKKAKVTYQISPKDPTFINGYFYDIPDAVIKVWYEEKIRESLIKNKERLDQKTLENEVKRITEYVRTKGYYKFNASNEEIYFTADTLESKKQVPLTLEIHKDSADSPYKITTIGDIKMFYVDRMADTVQAVRDSLRGINFYKLNDRYKTAALWRPIILKTGEKYDQRNLDLTKRNISATNNFSIIGYRENLRKGADSILDVTYYLAGLPQFEFKVSTDINYSQILNFGISPSVDLTTRNLFGGAENLTTSLSGIFGSVQDPRNQNKRNLAYEVSIQNTLSFPRLLLPFQTWKVIPKRYSPTSSIVIGASVQDNIGLGRIGFNAGLNYYANVNDVVSHRLSIFNSQLSLTQNKERYYDYFTGERQVVDQVQSVYFAENPEIKALFDSQQLSVDDVSAYILQDENFLETFSQNQSQADLLNSYLQSLFNKDRQTQDVLISSMIYNFVYNEIGKKEYKNPVYFNAKFELAGNVLSLFAKKTVQDGLTTGDTKTIFNVPYSQFVKFDFDVRKYFTFFNGKHTLALRQFIGLGIPYGNSTIMPYVRSYFNGGSNDIRAWRVFGGLGPADSQMDEKVRSYIMDNVKLTTNIEYRMPFTQMFEGAAFVDAGNIWSLKSNRFQDEFKFSKFINQMGVGTGLGLRVNVAYITLRLDAAYKVYDPNMPVGDRFVITKWQPLKPVLNFAFGYPF